MCRIRVKMLLAGELAIIDEGNVILFDNIGRVIKENAELLPKYTNGMLNLPVISVLSSNGKVEIALFERDNMTRYATNEDALAVAMRVQSEGKILRLLRRDGKFENTRFNQLLFIYPEGTPLQDKLKNIQVQKCTD